MSAVRQNTKIKAYIITDNLRLWQIICHSQFFCKKLAEYIILNCHTILS